MPMGSYRFSSYDMYEVYEVFMILAVIAALTLTILSVIFITPAKKRNSLPKFFQLCHDIFNFKGLFLEKILKFTYIFATLYVIIGGFFGLFFSGSGEAVISNLLAIVITPIIIRLFYELFMMIILLVKNVIEINNKLADNGKKTDNIFNPQMPEFKPGNVPTYTAPAQNYNNAPVQNFNNAPAQNYNNAPAQNYNNAPAQSFDNAPAPSYTNSQNPVYTNNQPYSNENNNQQF